MADPCAICGSPYLAPFLDLGEQPLAEAYGGNGTRWPLRMVRCASCTLVQLAGPHPPQADVFPGDHPYAAGDTAANRAHFARLAVAAGWRLRHGDAVTDIGANDGSLLECFGGGIFKVAVEPTGQAGKIKGASVYPEFFTAGLARRIREQYGRMRLVTACNVLAHVPDPHDFMTGVALLLDPDGEFVTENHDLRSITDGLQVDTVYHEHRFYYDSASLSRLLAMHGLAVTDCVPVARHGGSFRVTARRTGAGDLQRRAERARDRLHALLDEASQRGRIWGVSASTRATPLIHFAGLDRWLDAVAEVPGSAKIGSTIPGTTVRIRDEAELIAARPATAVLFCWHIADSVVPKLRAAGYEGTFIVPLPEAGYYRG